MSVSLYAVIASGLWLALAGLVPGRLATAAAALYLLAHAALHAVMESVTRNAGLTWAEVPGVYIPAVVVTVIAGRFALRDLSVVSRSSQSP
jgi:hypothetical protein